MSESRPYRRFLPIWLWLLLALAAGVILALRWKIDLGDRGMGNVLTMATMLVTMVVVTPWFLFFSRFRRRTRFLTAAAAFALLLLFVGLFRVESFSGEMIPQVVFRHGRHEPPPPVTADAGRGRVDLRTTTPDDFPGFLGRDRTMAVRNVRLVPWDEQAPELLWRQPIGAGWSAFSIVNGIAVTMEQREQSEMVTAYDLMTGELLWSQANPGRFEHPLGGTGPRSTPAIDEGRVYALTAHGMLLCLDGADGSVLWQVDLLEEFDIDAAMEMTTLFYGRSNSPLIVGDLVVLPAGGDYSRPPASLAAWNKVTGEKIWEGGDRQISFSSPRLATVAGVEQILILNEDTASGHDPTTGRKLWQHPWPGKTAATATSSQAKPIAPDRVFLSKGYGGGAAVLQLQPNPDGTFEAREVWHSRRVLRTKFTNVAFRDGHAYGLSDGILECVDLETGERVWKAGRYHHGQILLAGDALLVLSEDGELVMVEATPDTPNRVLGRVAAVDGPTWNNLALYGPYLAVRNGREAAVFKLALAG